MIIAIDGPSGAGKSTVAKTVARELGFSCLDTGAMYRAIAWKALKDKVGLSDNSALGDLAQSCVISFEHERGNPAPQKILIDTVDVTDAIRSSDIDRAVSAVAAAPLVRSALVKQQQRIGSEGNYVVEGRDIGTTVFPQAEVKIFLTASDQERARRRVAQNTDRGVGSTDYNVVLADIALRDKNDSLRAESPLKAAEDALRIDSTSSCIDEVVASICKLAFERGAGA